VILTALTPAATISFVDLIAIVPRSHEGVVRTKVELAQPVLKVFKTSQSFIRIATSTERTPFMAAIAFQGVEGGQEKLDQKGF
jgi:hypothetical protein